MQRISSIRFLGYLELVFRANNMSAKQSEQNSAGWEPWSEELQPIGYRAKDREHG